MEVLLFYSCYHSSIFLFSPLLDEVLLQPRSSNRTVSDPPRISCGIALRTISFFFLSSGCSGCFDSRPGGMECSTCDAISRRSTGVFRWAASCFFSLRIYIRSRLVLVCSITLHSCAWMSCHTRSGIILTCVTGVTCHSAVMIVPK